MMSRLLTFSVKSKTKWERRYAQETSHHYSSCTGRRCWQCPGWSSSIIRSSWPATRCQSSSVCSLTNHLMSQSRAWHPGKICVALMDCMRAGLALKIWTPLSMMVNQNILKNSLMKIIVWGKSGYHGFTINFSLTCFTNPTVIPKVQMVVFYHQLENENWKWHGGQSIIVVKLPL